MAGYRPAPQAYQYTSDEGEPLAGGSLTYSETGGSTPKSVYSDEAATISLGAVLTLNAAGRAPDHFLSGEYRQIVKDADGDQVSLRDNVRDQVTGGVTLPDPGDGEDGDVVVVSGAGFALETITRLPDPTGSDGYHVVVDGGEYILQAPDAGFSDTTLPGGVYQSGTTYTQIGKMRTYYGSGSAPTSGSDSTSVVVTGMAFVTGPVHVTITPTIDDVTPEGAGPLPSWSSPTTVGFTAKFTTPHEDLDVLGSNIDSAVTFTYSATGLVA